MDSEFELEWQKSFERQSFEINSMFRTSVHAFFPDLSRAYNMVLAIEDKIVYGNDLKGKKITSS